MVELKLDASDAGSIANDYYIGVRVGDAQKFSKVAATRSFKFSDKVAEGRRYGKVELFKRMGSCSISLDKGLEKSIQEICFSSAGDVKFKVGLGQGIDTPKVSPDPDLPAEDEKTKAAKEYLQAHHIELRLAEAMRSVLRERPDDPAAFIAERLTGAANMVKVTPAPVGALPSSKPLSPENAATAAFQQKPSVGSWCVPRADPAGATVPGCKQIEVAQLAPEVEANSAQQALKKEAFPSEEEDQIQAARARFAQLPSAGTWCVPLIATLPDEAFPSQEEVAVMKSQAQSALNALFGGDDEGEDQNQAARARFAKLPSVGTWCAPLSSGLDEASSAVTSATPMHLSPSVGTWLIPRPADEAPTGPRRNMCGVSTQHLLGPGFYGFGMRPSFRCI